MNWLGDLVTFMRAKIAVIGRGEPSRPPHLEPFPDWTKALLAVGLIFSSGIYLGFATMEFRTRTHELEQGMEEHREMIRQLIISTEADQRDLDSIIERLETRDDQLRCLALEEDARRCIRP